MVRESVATLATSPKNTDPRVVGHGVDAVGPEAAQGVLVDVAAVRLLGEG